MEITKQARTSQLQDYLNYIGVKVTATLIQSPLAKHIYVQWIRGKATQQISSKAPWEETAFHYTVKLELDGRSIVTPFKCGFAHAIRNHLYPNSNEFRVKPIPPTSADVISSLVLDASACESTFEQWAGDYGYDTDSRKALECYLACQQSGLLIKQLLREQFDAVNGLDH